MGKLIVEISDELHDNLKKTAALNGITIKEITIALLDNFLKKQKLHHSSTTGFCGKWQDDRTAKQIIKDIKAHRKWMISQSKKIKKIS